MSQYDQIMTALRNAHAAGDRQAAQRLAQMAMDARQGADRQATWQAARDGTLEATPESLDRAAASDQRAEDRMTIAQNPIATRAAVATQGLPFVGEWVDEAIGMVSPEGQDRVRNATDAFSRERPGEALALRLGGGVTGSVPLAFAAVPSVAGRATSLLGKGLAVGGAGLAAGAVEGGISGAGRGRNNSERRQFAGQDALIGGGAGLVAGVGGTLVGAGARNLIRWAKTSDVDIIARELKVSREAAQTIRGHLISDNLDAAQDALRRAGGDSMLADAGPSTAQALDTAMSSGGAATRIGVDRVTRRANAMQERVVRSLDNVLGQVDDGRRAANSEIAQRTAAARTATYNRAYGTPINYASNEGQAIEAVVSRIPSRVLRPAIEAAEDAMQEAGERNWQIMARISDDGTVSFAEMPNVRQLDYIKRGLGAVVEAETDSVTGQISQKGLLASRLQRDLRAAIGDAVPSYNQAVRLGGDKIAEQRAYNIGTHVLRDGTRREDVVDAMRDASAEMKDAFKRGLRLEIDEIMARAQRTAADPETDAREVLNGLKALSSRAARSKLTAALGPQEAARVTGAIDQAAAAIELRARTARNSATAIRAEGQRAGREALEPGLLGQAARGEAIGATKRALQATTNTTPQADLARFQTMQAEIADALTRIRGPEADRALAIVRRAMNGQPATNAQVEQVAAILGRSGALGLYQTATQSLENR